VHAKIPAMKIRLILCLTLLGGYSVLADIPDFRAKVFDYGLLTLPTSPNDVKAPQSPSGVAHIYNTFPTVVATTNRISAKLGSAFGIIYEISDSQMKDGDSMKVDIVMSYPMMTKPDGSRSQGFTWPNQAVFKDGKSWSFVDYSFDHDYELVTGKWRFEVMCEGKILCSQDFIVY
jgi:Domain of unknown function (DUF3859)